MRLAALDLGSNSFHLIVVETRPDGTFVPLVREKQVLGLGDVVAREGEIGEEKAIEASDAAHRLVSLARTEGAEEVVAVATAAIREARDGTDLVERLEAENGLEIEVLSGVGEARLIFEAIRRSVVLEPAPALAADLGGGSLELTIGDQAGPSFATSLRLGVGRLTAELVRSDPPSNADLARLRDRVRQELTSVVEAIERFSPRLLVGSSGTLLSLARLAAQVRDGVLPEAVNQLFVEARHCATVHDLVLELPCSERVRLAGLDQRRAEIAPAGVVVLAGLFELTGLEGLTVSDWALREGVVLRAIGRHTPGELASDPGAIRRSGVLALGRRYDWRGAHAHHVARLATQLFDGLVPLHGLGRDERELLEFGALLHDIGGVISPIDHPRHTAYLLEHAALRGFTPEELAMLICLGRFHLRGTPKASFPAFGLLDADRREVTERLLALLRVADGLDRSYASVVSSIEIEIAAKTITLRSVVRGTAEIERWALRRAGKLLEQQYGRTLVVRLESSGRDDYVVDQLAGWS
jgi:exopolyphosphatase/guanosine-5'-triphosphate,3'-diphosphate pyrophosphatase